MKHNWKKGDWCLFRHGVYQIVDISEDGRINSLSDGSGTLGGYDYTGNIFPLTLEGKGVADWYHHQYDELHRLPGSSHLNWPELSDLIAARFEDAMQASGELRQKKHKTDHEYFQEVKKGLAQAMALSIGTFWLLRR